MANLESYIAIHGYASLDNITPEFFKEIVYQLGMYKKYPEIRPRYIDEGNLKLIEAELRLIVMERFKSLAPLYYFNENGSKIFVPSKTPDQNLITKFFSNLLSKKDYSEQVVEGVGLHIITTNYDFIPEAILDAIYGSDGSFLFNSYRGITSSRISGLENQKVILEHWLVNNLFKINGGFEIFQTQEGFEIDYRKKDISDIRRNPPQIMLPSKEQDYTQVYFKAIFPKIVRLLQESKILVIVGYSLPEEDALIRFLIRQFAEDNTDGYKKILFYVDLLSEEEQRRKVESIFPHSGERNRLNLVPFSGSFSNWVKLVKI